MSVADFAAVSGKCLDASGTPRPVPTESEQITTTSGESLSGTSTNQKQINIENKTELERLETDKVNKTQKVGSTSLSGDITATNIQNDIKDLTATLTNKTIDADDNTISNLEADNFKSSAKQTGTTDNDKFAMKGWVDDKIAEVVRTTYTFKGYVGLILPTTGVISGELGYEGATMPTTFPIDVKTWNGTEWSSTTTEYTPVNLDLWSNLADNHGYYWFGNDWNILDTSTSLVDNVYIERNLQDEITIKDNSITESKLSNGFINSLIMQVSSLPVASADNLGRRVLYNNKQYKCLTDGSVYFWSEVANGIIKVDDNLPTDNIVDTAVYCLDEMTFIYNNVPYGNLSISAYKREGNVLTIDENGITQGGNLTAWDSVDTTLINSYISSNWLSMITIPAREWTDAIKGTIEIMAPSDGSFYGWVGDWHLSRVFSYYAHTEEGWLLLASSSQSVPYPSLSQLPTLNGETILGDKTSADYKISRLMTEEEYNNLTEAEKMNGTTYMVIASSTGAVNVDTRSYNNLTNKISINGIILQEGMTSADLDFYTRGQIDAKLSGVFHLKGVVADLASLPSTANNGDVYYVTSESGSYAYGDSGWQSLGNAIDLSAYQTKDDNALATTSKNIVGAINELNVNKQDKSNLITAFPTTPTDDTYPSSKLTHDSLLLKEDKSNKVISIDANSTNDQYPSAKAVYDNFAPLNANCVRISNGVSNIDGAIFDFSNQNTSTGARQVESRYFMQVSLPDPITTSDTMYGYVITEQSLVSAYQVRIIQTFTSTFHNGSDGLEGKTQKVFRRVGVITSNDTNILFKPLTNSSSITWYSWIPIEYPAITIARDTTNTSSGLIKGIISGGTLKIEIDGMKLNSAPGTDAVKVAILPTGLRTALKSWSLGYYRGFAFSIASTPHSGLIQIKNDTENILVFGNFNANEAFWGAITAQLGY